MKDCIIVIPAYKRILTDSESDSLCQVKGMLGGMYDITLVAGRNLDTTAYGVPAWRVGDDWFSNRITYSDLCKHPVFYEHFKDYEYMLLYQLDAWVFRKDLAKHICKGYDYIGAPHLRQKDGLPIVGNGGLSLRRIDKFSHICRAVDFDRANRWEEDRAFTEGHIGKLLNLATLEDAFRFSVQGYYPIAQKVLKGELPFGAHQGELWGTDYVKAVAATRI